MKGKKKGVYIGGRESLLDGAGGPGELGNDLVGMGCKFS